MCDHSSVKCRNRVKEEKENIGKKLFWSGILQSCIRSTSLSFGLDPRGDYVGFPPSLGMASKSQRVERGPMSEQGPPPWESPLGDLHNKSTEPSLGMLVLINDIKVDGHKTASGASRHSCNSPVSRSADDDTVSVRPYVWWVAACREWYPIKEPSDCSALWEHAQSLSLTQREH